MKNNVLVIMCDQLRKDCLGCYGNEYIETPNIDKLAKESIICSRNYVANPICMPNRLSLFSGMYPRNHGLWTNGLLIKDRGYTLMHSLNSFGYQTASIGKIHFEPCGCEASSGSKESDDWWSSNPKAQDFHGPFWGFDYIELADKHHGESGHMIKWFKDNGGKPEMFTSKEGHTIEDETGWDDVPKNLHSSSFVGERMCNYLKNIRNKEKPFFAVASFPDPHHPFTAPKVCYDKVHDKPFKKPIGSPDDLLSRPTRYKQMQEGIWNRNGISKSENRLGIGEELAKERTLNTYGMIELIDENVGKIIDELKSQNLWDNTIVIFTSDHGDLLGDFGLWKKGPFFFNGLVNTPLLVHIPKVAPRKCDNLISSVDLAPTICSLLKLPVPYYMDGLSQDDVLVGKEKQKRKNCMIEYHNGYFENDLCYKVLITDRYKYCLCQTGEEELTDLTLDPNEINNVANNPEYKNTVTELKSELLLQVMKTESKVPLQLSLA